MSVTSFIQYELSMCSLVKKKKKKKKEKKRHLNDKVLYYSAGQDPVRRHNYNKIYLPSFMRGTWSATDPRVVRYSRYVSSDIG